MLFLWRNHGCQLLQIAYHQELHTTKRQIVALAILAKHRIYSIEQIAAHHTDFVDNEQVDTADDIALEFAELIAFLFAAAKGRARHVWREGKLEERMDGHSSGVDGCNARRSKHNHSFGRQFFQSLKEGRLTCARLSGKEEVGICLFYDIPCQDGFFVHFHTASFCTRFYIRTRFLLISELDFFRDFAHLLALLLCAWTVFSNMTYRNDYHRLIALASKELLHLRRIVIADPAGAQSLFGGSQTEMLCRYRHINIAMRFLIISAHPVLIHVFIPIIYIGAVLNHSRS